MIKTFKSKTDVFMKVFFLFLLAPIFYILNTVVVSAATLTLSPSSGTYKQGSYITVNVLVSSTDNTMNAASGVVSFPTDLLSVSSISKSGSIVNFWAQEPSFSNSAGTVNFEGVLLPPGFTGSSGKIIAITFKAKSTGTAIINFSSGSVLAADGTGTDILTFSGSASLDITEATEVTPTPTKVVSNLPAGPTITSSTHPDQNAWYVLKDANFSWDVTKDVTRSSVLVDRSVESLPTVSYSPATDSKQEKNLDEGIWYIHVQLKNSHGWGDVSNFRFQIDTEKPTKFDIEEVKRENLSYPKVKFTFDASDKTSGIDHYEVQIDDGTAEVWKDDGSHQYITPVLSSGSHILTAKAVDKAGNWLSNSAEFTIEKSNSSIIAYILSTVVPLIFIFIILLIIWYVWRRFFILFKRKTKKDVHGMEMAIHKAFELLKDNVREQIKMLERARTKRELTDEEEKIIRHLRKDLDDAEKFIRKEVEGVEKRIK